MGDPGDTGDAADKRQQALILRTGRMWELLLGGIAAEASLPYFRQFLARESLRRAQSALVVPKAD
ncbi:A-factor receptor protein [Mycobacterium tuberculosis]|nr:A-factor receptor protein [Mycobacterium tuberculosis]